VEVHAPAFSRETIAALLRSRGMRSLILLLALSNQAWLADFQQILHEMSSHYANLDSAVDDRHLDLAAIRKTAESRIAAAKNDAEAKEAIDWFVRQFGDGHAWVNWNASTSNASAEEDRRPLCERLGYSRREPGGLDFSQLPGYTPVRDDDALYFPGGILRLADRKRLGILRIHLFMETAHPELCTQAIAALKLSGDAKCEGDCGYRVSMAAANLLTAALERRIEALHRAGATALVVDITGNGGGSDWVEPAARVLTPVPLRAPRLAFIRHPHWSSQLRQQLADIEGDLQKSPSPELEKAAQTVRAAIAEAERPCDRSSLWDSKKPDCSLVPSTPPLHSTGVLAYAKPGAFPESLVSRGTLFYASQYTYREGVNRLPLFVLTDGGTASASELFAAMLRDNDAARLVGTSTLGSGCGHTNGGIHATLKNSGAELKLPDCVRLRTDGTNEVLGIVPDVLVAWRSRDSAFQRAVKAARALDSIVR
jgi:hypothetical protein